MNQIIYPIVFLYGIVIGSFLNVCIYRIPKGEDVIRTRSHCMNCGHWLRWYELLPVVSYLFQRGRCRNCGEKLSLQYPMVELLNGILYVWIIWEKGITPEGILLCILSSTLLVISVIDLKTFTIPLGLNVMVFFLGLVRAGMELERATTHLIGMVVVSGFLWLLYWLTKGKGIGDGDIKLMIGAGTYLGVTNSIFALWLACFLGSILHGIRMKLFKASHQLAFGPYLSVGIIIAALYGQKLIQWYLQWMFP
ncbi:prepilin peptidase [Anaerosporobacter faecicola]|uniref:prepilin peptidase n=1 Tax=Anaerosporobacter faecicola TaxID=2718714 RepID=UPI00143A281D|nr:A24 family peptidase [Anaerosporobacter faecicola]